MALSASRFPLISEIHTAVPGRARLSVAGLRNRPELKDSVEAELSAWPGIRSVSANTFTGNVLILYEPGREVAQIVGFLDVVIRSPKRPRGRKPKREATKSGPARLAAAVAGLLGRKRSEPPAAAGMRAQPQVAWHRSEAGEVVRFWETPATGLATATAAERLARYGPNMLKPPRQRSVLSHFVDQFQSLPVLLLLGSAALSISTGGLGDAIVISAVVLLNASIGCAMEVQAERTIHSLLEVAQPPALVIRDGAARQIPAAEVVPGDFMLLKRGDPIVADARLLKAADLTIDEAALTGESVPVEKNEEPVEGGAVADRLNMVYRGTTATGGSGLAVVVATGAHTEIGRVQSLISETVHPETPLQTQMSALGRQMVWVTGAVAGAVFMAGLLRGFSAVEMLKSAVSLAVAAVPEGLPTVATVALANSVSALVRQDVLIRRLQAVETMGGIDVICFDKTGTLTLNRMAVAAVSAGRNRYDASGRVLMSAGRTVEPSAEPELVRLIEICCLCSEAEPPDPQGSAEIGGSPTEAALLRFAIESGIDVTVLRRRFPTQSVVRRARGRNYMLTRHASPDGRTFVAVKGNPLEVLELCRSVSVNTHLRPLTPSRRKAIRKENESMAAAALRVLGVAYAEDDGADLIWSGLAGIADPPREGLNGLLDEFRTAGIRPVMITGDQDATARAVGQAVGLNGGDRLESLEAVDLFAVDAADAAERVLRANIFSRVSPAQKLQIVQTFQRAGKVVAMTGDGINDGPALKAADVGIALGQGGTAVAREVADVVLTNDDIHAMICAIREGRRVHANIRRAIHYVASTNASEVLLMLGAIAAGMGQPLNPRQLLWINLLSDVFPELALALGPADADSMRRPPSDARRPVIGPREYGTLGRQTGIMAGSALAAYAYGLVKHGKGAAASSMAFLALTSAQLMHGITMHGAGGISNPYLAAGLASGFLLLALSQLAPGITSLLGASALGASDVLVCAAGALASFLANEAMAKAQVPRMQRAGDR